MSIEGALRNYKRRSMAGLFTKGDGSECTDKEAREYLHECLAKGWRVIPMGDCDNFDYQEGCKGHDIRHYCDHCQRTLSSPDEKCNCNVNKA